MSISPLCLRNSTATTWRFVARLLVTSALVAAPGFALANPSSGQVVAGTAAIAPGGGSTLSINQTSPRAIIDWRSFNIAVGETTQFNQPGPNAITLNRVTGADPSQILGNLSANGQIWLINANGILFGKTARVDVAGLLATTIDVANSDFMAGTNRFSALANPGAMVVNAGQITIHNAGLAALVAPGVENSGVIEANLGQIQLSSAAAFTLDLYGDGLFNFTLDKQVTQAITRLNGTSPLAAVSNSGQLIADGGHVLLTANVARSVINNAINMDGIAQATSTTQSHGEIVLDGGSQGTVQVAGTLDASANATGASGGKIEVLGDTIHLTGSARVNASGPAGGGKVLVGGDFLGGTANPQLQSEFGITFESVPLRSASTVTIDQGAVVNASATNLGFGGRIAVWSESATDVSGSLYAMAGPKGGNGGFVETSSHHAVDVANATVVVSGGPGDKWGHWLVDPTYTITAQSGFVDTGITNATGDLLVIVVTGGLGPDLDDGGIPDPSEQFEFIYPQFPPYSLVATIGGGSPFVLLPGPHFFTAQGDLQIALNKEDLGPSGAFNVTVDRISAGSLSQLGQNQNQILSQTASVIAAWSALGSAAVSGLEHAIDAVLAALGLLPGAPTPPPQHYDTSPTITSEDAAKAFVKSQDGECAGVNCQCVSLTRALVPGLPPSSLWVRGTLVEGNTNIPIGTAIATFNFYGQPGTNGYGPADSPGGALHVSHTGIYLGQNSKGIIVLNQWAGQAPTIITIPWVVWAGNSDIAGDRYYTIGN